MRAGFPHSEICGSKPICRLPAAYRRLSRPSSPVIAKASTTCTYSLDPITLHPLCEGLPAIRNPNACAPIRTVNSDGNDTIKPSVLVDARTPKQQAHAPQQERFTSSRIVKEQPTPFSRGTPPVAGKRTSLTSQDISAQASRSPRKHLSAASSLPTTTRPFLSPTTSARQKGLVEVNGIEPMTPCLQSRCSPS